MKKQNSTGLFIYRPPCEQDTDFVRSLQQRLENVPTFRRVRRPHLTLLPGSMTKQLSHMAFRGLTYPLPETTRGNLNLAVKDIELITIPRSNLASYTLWLEDKTGTFHDEYALFKARVAAKLGKIPFIREPHITLGYVKYEHATQQSLEMVSCTAMPVEMTFEPLITEPVMEVPDVPAECVHYVSTAEPVVVRTLNGSGLPNGFLARLATSYSRTVAESNQ